LGFFVPNLKFFDMVTLLCLGHKRNPAQCVRIHRIFNKPDSGKSGKKSSLVPDLRKNFESYIEQVLDAFDGSHPSFRAQEASSSSNGIGVQRLNPAHFDEEVVDPVCQFSKFSIVIFAIVRLLATAAAVVPVAKLFILHQKFEANREGNPHKLLNFIWAF
jgi:hypothetical protein